MRFKDAAPESSVFVVPERSPALASAECTTFAKRNVVWNPHERPNPYVHSAKESMEPILLFLSSEHSQTSVSPSVDHSYLRDAQKHLFRRAK